MSVVRAEKVFKDNSFVKIFYSNRGKSIELLCECYLYEGYFYFYPNINNNSTDPILVLDENLLIDIDPDFEQIACDCQINKSKKYVRFKLYQLVEDCFPFQLCC